MYVALSRGVTVLTVEGRIDVASAPPLDAALEELKGNRVLLDLSGLTFVDSSGVRLLAVHSRRMRQAGGALLVRCPSPPVRHVMTLTGIDTLHEPRTTGARSIGGRVQLAAAVFGPNRAHGVARDERKLAVGKIVG